MVRGQTLFVFTYSEDEKGIALMGPVKLEWVKCIIFFQAALMKERDEALSLEDQERIGQFVPISIYNNM